MTLVRITVVAAAFVLTSCGEAQTLSQAPSARVSAPDNPAVQMPLSAAPLPIATDMSANQRAGMNKQIGDWAGLKRYAADNAALAPAAKGEKRVVFYGDSITDAWGRRSGTFFPGKPYVNRGISGQTTRQMLVRFRQDVIDLHPAAVVILAGTNDIAGNTGPETVAEIETNLQSMAELARANGIRVVMASVLPVSHYSWRADVAPVETIRAVNTWMKDYCASQSAQHFVYLDYYSALVNGEGGMKEELAADKLVHPNAAGYDVMGPLAQAAVEKALGGK